jgi:hypothetical protein
MESTASLSNSPRTGEDYLGNDPRTGSNRILPLNPPSSSWRLTRPDNGWVYFIGGESGLVKIGWSGRPKERLASLKTASPVRLAILAQVRGPYAMETEYHRRFASHRRHGEWFERHPDILTEIERLQEQAS